MSGGARPGPGAGPSYSLVVAQHFAAFLHCHRREVPAVRAQAETLLARNHGPGVSALHRVWARLAGLGAGHAGERGRRGPGRDAPGPDAGRGRGARARAATLAGAARRGGGHVGQVAAGRRLLAEALAAFAASGQGDLLAEAHRLQGELWWRQITRITAQADACFQQALAIARQQQARSWELRAALSLSRLWQQQGKDAAARDLLAPIYGWFTEGFETVDLQEAQVLLEQLAG